MNTDWLAVGQVQKLLSGDTTQLQEYVTESPLRAINADLDFLVAVRDHYAWFIEGQGWRDANQPAAEGKISRQAVNYYTRTAWCKLPVPVSVHIEAVTWDGDAFVFHTRQGEIRSAARQVRLAVQDSMTGRAQSEEQIEHNFRKLDGSVPLQGMNDSNP